jgi:hypothetical protein
MYYIHEEINSRLTESRVCYSAAWNFCIPIPRKHKYLPTVLHEISLLFLKEPHLHVLTVLEQVAKENIWIYWR